MSLKNYVVYTKKDNVTKYYLLKNQFTPFNQSDRLELANILFAVTTEVNGKVALSIVNKGLEEVTLENRNNEQVIIAIEDSMEDALMVLRSKLNRRSIPVDNLDNHFELKYTYANLYFMFQNYYARTMIFDELEAFQNLIPSIEKIVDRKITFLKELYLIPMSEKYNNQKRKSEYKEHILHQLVNDTFDDSYLTRLYNNLSQIKNIVFKNQELMDFLDEQFVKDLFILMDVKGPESSFYRGNRDKTIFYKSID